MLKAPKTGTWEGLPFQCTICHQPVQKGEPYARASEMKGGRLAGIVWTCSKSCLREAYLAAGQEPPPELQ